MSYKFEKAILEGTTGVYYGKQVEEMTEVVQPYVVGYDARQQSKMSENKYIMTKLEGDLYAMEACM